MATIALRTYLNQIEGLIEGGQTAEAIAHCRHILQRFPKNIATYRVIAKAYLEQKQHAEAGDIFQRVLSSSPDDFIAHIGMSIIREEAGDLDAAIWHMERAFEAQPSNRAVQDELRSLYTKREGYAPPKVRLTRGALARMYAHGDLHNQAIGELRSALAEDPQRPDLQVLLADMLLKTQQNAEATEICGQLIEKFPYSLFANRAMAEMLASEGREIEAAPYQERVEELDPYAALIDTRGSPDNVPANNVMVEKLVVESAPPPATETWPAPEADIEPSEAEALPDWLSVEPEGEESEAGEPANSDEPAFVEETGDEPEQPRHTSSLLEELENLEPDPASQTGQLERYGKTHTAALIKDSVPEWLRDLAPATRTLKEPPPEERDWADELNKAGLQTGSLPEELAAAPEPEAEPQPEASPAPVDDEESLRWLEGLAASQGAEEEELLTTPEDRQAPAPEWAPQADAEPQSEALNWLDEMEQRQQTGSLDEAAAPPATEQPLEAEAAGEAAQPAGTDRLDEIFADAPFGGEQSQPADDAPAEDDTPGWLNELSAEIEESPSSGTTQLQPLEDTPDWLNELRYQTGELTLPEDEDIAPTPEAEAPAEPEGAAEENGLSKLDWLEELGPPSHQPTAGAWVPETELGDENTQAGEPETIEPIAEETEPPGFAAQTAQPAPSADPLPEPETNGARAAAEPLEKLRSELAGKGKERDQDDLQAARQAMNAGDREGAVRHYDRLLRRRKLLPEVIADLQAATSLQPEQVALWQALGDAYMRSNQLRQALECYTRAEDLLKHW
ncbi:MAG: tetratricopeptide repeat protein [Anaerolineales bacterium]|nr:tetratricopeptide repeat protein [Anaerolineales bacterium]